MSVETPDSNFSHLDPIFIEKLRATLALANHDSKHPDGTAKFPRFHHWALFEGYRSQARQDWLYAQGRTREGAIVTQLKVSKHTSRKAADIVWCNAAGQPHWDGPNALWQTLGHCARAHGLKWGGDWKSFKDFPHVEMP